MSDLRLSVTHIAFDGPSWESGPRLKLTAKRYKPSSANSDEGLILLFTHCIGGHKELWEPTIERIFRLQDPKDKRHRIREVYSFDRQNHGEGAVLNEEALVQYPNGVSSFAWAAAIADFIKAYQIDGEHTVAIGHSAGAGTFMNVPKEFSNAKPPFCGIILAEPTLVIQALYDENIDVHKWATEMAVKLTKSRRDTWSDKEAAIEFFSKRQPWKFWDPRVVKIYAENGLKTSHTAEGDVVTLKCIKEQEALGYSDIAPNTEAAARFSDICKRIPIHIIWGTRNDFNPTTYQESLSDESQGRKAASVAKVEGAGHMIVQQKPDALADAICSALDKIEPKLVSKL